MAVEQAIFQKTINLSFFRVSVQLVKTGTGSTITGNNEGGGKPR
jgi:hypothetical protein